jgi:hypothetical protein
MLTKCFCYHVLNIKDSFGYIQIWMHGRNKTIISVAPLTETELCFVQ